MKFSVVLSLVLSVLFFVASNTNFEAAADAATGASSDCETATSFVKTTALLLFSAGVLALCVAVCFQLLDLHSKQCNALHILLCAAAVWVAALLAFSAFGVMRAMHSPCRAWVWKLMLVDSVGILVLVGTLVRTLLL
jgi:hypothetical protein